MTAEEFKRLREKIIEITGEVPVPPKVRRYSKEGTPMTHEEIEPLRKKGTEIGGEAPLPPKVRHVPSQRERDAKRWPNLTRLCREADAEKAKPR
jgi:hypothetical protein